MYGVGVAASRVVEGNGVVVDEGRDFVMEKLLRIYSPRFISLAWLFKGMRLPSVRPADAIERSLGDFDGERLVTRVR